MITTRRKTPSQTDPPTMDLNNIITDIQIFCHYLLIAETISVQSWKAMGQHS